MGVKKRNLFSIFFNCSKQQAHIINWSIQTLNSQSFQEALVPLRRTAVRENSVFVGVHILEPVDIGEQDHPPPPDASIVLLIQKTGFFRLDKCSLSISSCKTRDV